MQLKGGLTTARIGVRMSSLESRVHEAYTTHRAAYGKWNNGEIDKSWTDENNVLCIRYTSGKWWHYDKNKDGDWIWW